MRLASQLTRWDIDILTEAEESERRQEEFRRRTGLFVEALDVDDVIAGLLVTEGFNTVEELAFTPLEEVAAIEGFDENVAEELIRRAEAFLTRRDTELTEKRVELGVTDEVAAIEALTPAMLVALGEKGVKTLDDLADLASDELIEIVGADEHGRGDRQRGDHGRARALVRGRGSAGAEASARRPSHDCSTDCRQRRGRRTTSRRKPARCAAASSRASGCRRSG